MFSYMCVYVLFFQKREIVTDERLEPTLVVELLRTEYLGL